MKVEDFEFKTGKSMWRLVFIFLSAHVALNFVTVGEDGMMI